MASQIPMTTQPGPDQAELQALIRRLAEAVPRDAPILSVYLDVRPRAHGEAPGRRPETVLVRDRLRQIAESYDPHALARPSIDADAERIVRLVTDAEFDGVDGVAIFACHEIGLWEELRAPVPFDTEIGAGTSADLFQAARLLADSEPAVVALVDTNTCRLFVTRFGVLVERSGRDEPPDEHRRHDQGGWSQARYQRHIDVQDKRFAAEAAKAIEQLVDEANARHVVLAGDERALKVLQPELAPRIAALVEREEHIGIRAGSNEVAEEVEPLLAAFREAAEAEAADRVVAGVRAGELGVAGIDTVAAALEAGQVSELVLDRAAPIDEARRAELVRQAALTSASVVVVDGHEPLLRLGGVGATLRYRMDETR
jgi:peptide chain release factor subunit 1